MEDGAKREVLEETNAKIDVKRLFSVVEILNIGIIVFCYIGEMLNSKYYPGEECLDVKLFENKNINGSMIAFEAHKTIIRLSLIHI